MYQNSGVVKDTTGPHTHSSPKEYDVAFKTFGKNGFEIVFSEWDITSLPDGWSCCRNTSLYDYPPVCLAGIGRRVHSATRHGILYCKTMARLPLMTLCCRALTRL
jgi:hypothetical protein